MKGGPGYLDASLRAPKHVRKRIQILSLAGGGYRGLFSALLLQRLEDECQLRDCFDLVAGTSVGGIIACGIAAGIPAGKISAALEKHGPRIFKWRRVREALRPFVAKYPSRPLSRAIDEVLGEQSKGMLNDIAIPLVVTSVSQTGACARIFYSRGTSRSRAGIRLSDVALATAAAPTYFRPLRIDSETLIDGGLVANAPDLVALTEALKGLGAELEEVHMLSIGTAAMPSGSSAKEQGAPGSMSWVLRRGLFELAANAQETLAVEQCQAILGGRYIRVNATPAAKQWTMKHFDCASREATENLKYLANEAFERLMKEHRGVMREFASHKVKAGGVKR